MLITLVAAGLAAVIAIYSWGRYRPIAIIVPLWLVGAWALSRHGFFQSATGWSEGDLAGFMLFGTLMTLPLVLFFIAWRRSPGLRAFGNAVPLPGLIGIEVYRLAGAVFLWLYGAGLLPAELGITTGIADVTIGALALPLAWAVARQLPGRRGLAIGWNLFGIADFAIAVTIVSLSIFGVVSLQPEPVMIGMHPLALIALFQLPISICIHWLALRRLVTPTGHLNAVPFGGSA
jgi:hypothetical protein